MPFEDVPGSAGTLAPAQNVAAVPKLKVGVTIGFTVTVSVVTVAHGPAAGVNVYVPEFWLSIVAGFHVPLMPLVEVDGSVGTAFPAQIVSVVPKLNVGTVLGVTVTAKEVVVAHWPAVGVKV